MKKDDLLKQLKGLNVRINKKQVREVSKSSKLGTKPNETRATYILKDKTVERVKDLSKETGKPIKSIVQEALENYLDNNNLKQESNE